MMEQVMVESFLSLLPIIIIIITFTTYASDRGASCGERVAAGGTCIDRG
jgi:hypothetical protein